MKINIAIDGPAGAGKSTVARMVADSLGYIYVDTGAMYRAVTWMAILAGISPNQTEAVINMARDLELRFEPDQLGQKVFANGMNITAEIRTAAVNKQVSAISQIPEIREMLTKKQKQMANCKGVVMDGRDIGTHVLPNAELKIFLTATVEVRAKRRFKEMNKKDPSVTLEQLKQEIAERDRMDEEREVCPLIRAEDAILVNTTELSILQVAEHILELLPNRRNEARR